MVMRKINWSDDEHVPSSRWYKTLSLFAKCFFQMSDDNCQVCPPNWSLLSHIMKACPSANTGFVLNFTANKSPLICNSLLVCPLLPSKRIVSQTCGRHDEQPYCPLEVPAIQWWDPCSSVVCWHSVDWVQADIVGGPRWQVVGGHIVTGNIIGGHVVACSLKYRFGSNHLYIRPIIVTVIIFIWIVGDKPIQLTFLLDSSNVYWYEWTSGRMSWAQDFLAESARDSG